MPLDKKKLEGLRRTVKRHLNWLVREIAGEDALTEEEKKDLEGFKPLPKQASDFIQRSFILGRLKSILKKKEYKEITLSELDQAIKDADLTPLEQMALDEARRGAGNYIKNLAADIEAGVFQRLSEAEGQIVTEATIRNIIREETAFAVLEQKTWKELANSMSDSLKVEYSKRLEMIARTELHSAKQKGIAQAIANKTDIYGSSDGPDSNVSVITQTGRCEDCARLYEDKDGNPKIFKLSHLLGNGSNANRNHKKVNKQHIHWVPVVPPSHPHCFCELVYVPPGYIWKDRRLVLEDRDKLEKAIGDSTLSATRKPKGPPQKGPTPPKQPGNIPGMSSPAKTSTATGTATAQADATATVANGGGPKGGSGIEYEYWKGTGSPPGEGNWEAYEKRDGGQGYRRPLGSGNRQAAKDEQSDKTQVDPSVEAMNWGKQEHPDAVKLDHMSRGKVVHKEQLGTGASESYVVSIEGNGRACMKPPAFHNNYAWNQGILPTEGNQSIPLDTPHKREEAAYHAHVLFGLNDFVPPTATRSHEGQAVSMQSWSEDSEAIMTSILKPGKKLNNILKAKYGTDDPTTIKHLERNSTKALLDVCPDDKRDRLIQKLNDGAVMALALNHNDQHLDNILVNDDFDVKFVDNSLTAANGMEGAKVVLLRDFHNMGRKVKVSDTMLTRFKNTSLGDLQRALGGHLEDWAIGQTFIRTRYLMHLQETEGHIDYEKFRTTTGVGLAPASNARAPMWNDWDDSQRTSPEFQRRKEAGLLQNQLFESFAKQWIEDAKGLPEDHPDHIAAKQLDEIGIFMGPGFNVDKRYREAGKHREYEKTIKPGYPPKDLKSSKANVTSDLTLDKTHVSNEFSHAKTEISTPQTVRLNSDEVQRTSKPLRDPGINRPPVNQDSTVRPDKKNDDSTVRPTKTKKLNDDATRKPLKKSASLFVRLDK